MKTYSLSHLSDHALLRDLVALVAQERTTTASMLAHIAEVDARKLYLPAAYPSMYSYCVQELRLSEDSACKRIRAARAARQFPAIFTAVAEGRLHLGAVVLLAPCLTPEYADELLAAAAHKSKAEIERLIAERFPRPDVPARVQVIPPPPTSLLNADQLAPGPVEQHAPGRVELSAPGRIDSRPKTVPLAPQRFALQLTMGQETHDKLRYAQELLSHQVPSGDLAEVLDRAFDALIVKLEKRKFASTTRPSPRHAATGGRYIPAHVKRAVWQRDQGQCTFVSEEGQRCRSRKFLEFDHIDPVARGGEATVQRVRLRCRAHNQHEAECTFGTEFMNHKRHEARSAAAEARALTRTVAEARAHASAAIEKAKERDVVPWLQALGFRADEARRAAAFCDTIPDAPLEERVRLALSFFHPRACSQDKGRAANGIGALPVLEPEL